MKKDELKRDSHPHITDSGKWIKTLFNIVKDNVRESRGHHDDGSYEWNQMMGDMNQKINERRLELEKKFGKPRSKYHRQFEVDNLYFKIMKIGETIRFNFAGSTDEGEIIEIRKEGNKIIEYIVWDGKYRYTVSKEQII